MALCRIFSASICLQAVGQPPRTSSPALPAVRRATQFFHHFFIQNRTQNDVQSSNACSIAAQHLWLLPLLDQAEATLNQYNLSAQDSAVWTNQRDSLLQVLETVNINQSAKLNLMSASQATALSNLLSFNANLTGSNTWQVNERAVNEIWLSTVALGIFEFSAAHRTTLENIASQCPVADGEAVLRARAMLTLVQDAPVAYDDTALCSGREQQRTSNALNAAVKVYPNPASDRLIVEYRMETGVIHRISLFNVYGQEVISQILPDGPGKLTLALERLASGVYWYQVSGGTEQLASGKVLIQR